MLALPVVSMHLTVVFLYVCLAARSAPQRTDYRVRVTDLPRGTDWRNIKDFLRTGGEVTYCNIESDGTAYVSVLRVLCGWHARDGEDERVCMD